MTFSQWVDSIVEGVNIFVVPMLFACVFLVFVWGVVKYFFLNGDNEEERRHGREFILWGILGMVLLFSVWGVVGILVDTLGITS